MIYSKTLIPSDYILLEKELKIVNDYYSKIKDICRFEHEHRRWEYSLALNLLRENYCYSVLEVGGGGSLFQPMLTSFGFDVVEIDNSDQTQTLEKQGSKLNIILNYERANFLEWKSQRQFDAVICLSVLEHIDHHLHFFMKLLKHMKVGGISFITFDFHPSGKKLVRYHERTYNIYKINKLIQLALTEHVVPILPLSYDKFEPNIYDKYTFASLALHKFSK